MRTLAEKLKTETKPKLQPPTFGLITGKGFEDSSFIDLGIAATPPQKAGQLVIVCIRPSNRRPPKIYEIESYEFSLTANELNENFCSAISLIEPIESCKPEEDFFIYHYSLEKKNTIYDIVRKLERG